MTSIHFQIFAILNAYGGFFTRVAHMLGTVLPQKNHTHRMLYNFASSRPITLVFTHKPRYINKFLWKKIRAHPPQK